MKRSVAVLSACIVFLIGLLGLSGCAHAWETIVVGPDGSTGVVNRDVVKGLLAHGESDGVPVDTVLYAAAYHLVSSVTVTDTAGSVTTYSWDPTAEDAWWSLDGKITLGGNTIVPAALSVEPLTLPSAPSVSITDLAPTAADALGLPAPAEATGKSLAVGPADRVLLMILDGFGYVRYTEARDAGLIPVLASLGDPLIGLTVYPPCTAVASAALLSGAPPVVNGVTDRGIRSTEVETVFRVLSAAERQVVAIEGDALAFNLRDAEIVLSGDRDGNGSTDDNVLTNALSAIEAGMPDLLWVHFHGIDDAGHTYGPGAPEEVAAIRGVDAAVGQLLEALPDGTLVLMVADHGMHTVDEEGRQGNHGHLIVRDMLIPVFVREP